MITSFLCLFLALSPARAGDDFEEIAGTLGLTADQKADVAEIVYETRTERIAIKARGAAARLELKHLLAAPTVDERAVMKALDALNAASAESRKNRVEQILEIRKVLSPDQWTQLSAIWDDSRDERREEREDEGE